MKVNGIIQCSTGGHYGGAYKIMVAWMKAMSVKTEMDR
jgi:hypothetical protein